MKKPFIVWGIMITLCSIVVCAHAEKTGEKTKMGHEMMGRNYAYEKQHHEKYMEALSKELSLTEEQKEKISKELSLGMEEIKAERDKMMEQIKTIREKHDVEIEKILTPEQGAKFKIFREKREKEMHEKMTRRGFDRERRMSLPKENQK